MISRRNLPDLLSLTAAVAITRFAFRSHLLYDLDSVDFALGMRRFDPHVYQPHPPGYFLYVCLGRLLNTVFHDANTSLVVLSILASCGLALVVYQMALDWFGLSAARFAGILFLFSPLAWFHGTVALTYMVGAFFSGLLGYLCWRIYCGKTSLLLPASVVFGLCAGIRPSSFLFLAPLFLFSLRRAGIRRIILALAVLLLVLLSWFVPMIVASGGLHAYFSALTELWNTVAAKKTIFNSSPTYSIARAFTIVFIYLLIFGAAALTPFAESVRKTPVDPRKKWFTLVWITPALCFFTFIFLLFVNSGYLLLLSAPASVWLGFWISEWYANAALRKPFKLAIILTGAAANVLIFLASPLYCSYRQVRHFESQLKSIQTALPQVASPDNTLIVSFDSHFLGFRHAGYYLPGYLTLEYPEVNLRGSIRVFAMHDRDTRFLATLPASYSQFVLFPLPAHGGAYQKYLQKILAKLPSQGLHTIRIDDHIFVTGPIADLPLLFPKLAEASK
jgi:hypothetical protein